jgi:sarcosine oxidase / L-pipecolate oxidase
VDHPHIGQSTANPDSKSLTLQPTDDNIVKVARHASGVVHYSPADADKPVSTPRTVLSHGDDGLRIPQSSLRILRSELRRVYPELAEKPFAATRLCW